MREKNQKKRMTLLQHLMLLVLIVCSSATLLAQTGPTKTIRGVVVDNLGVTIPGVNVTVKQTKGVGTITDFDGKFSIRVNEKATLVFTYIGYVTREITVATNDNLRIVLSEESKGLDEVVVIAYGTQKKATLTGAISSVGSAELMKAPVASLGLALAGKVTGLSSIQYSGAPGADDPTLYVRGVGSLSTSGSAPLVLVDGVERSFTQIDPNEVSDISILKDASATAVFGVRGANGVILVTTKRGAVGKTKISATASWGAQLPTLLMDFTNSYDFATFYNESQTNDGVLPAQLKFQPEVLDAFKNHTLPTVYPDIKWLKYMLEDYAPQSQYNVNLSGGTEKVKYFVSVGALNQGGLFKTFNTDKNNNFNYDRFNYRANIDVDITKTTRMAINLGGRVENRNFPANGESDIFRYLQASTPFGGAGIVDSKWIITNPANIVDPGRDGLDKVYGRGYSTSSKNVLNFDFQLTQDLGFITKGLDIKLKGSYNNSFDHIKNRGATIPSYMAVKQSDGTFQLQKNGDPSLLNYSESSKSARDWYSELSLNYKRKFGDHNVTALLLYNQVKRFYPSIRPDIASGYVGLVARATYDYKTRYLFDMNMGYNGSENFAQGDTRYGFFPSASLGWIVTNESFLRDQTVFSYLKIRGSFGLVGNDKMSGIRFLYSPDVYNISTSGYYFGTNLTTSYPAASEGSLGNPKVTWESALKEDIGVDINFFKDKLKINLDLFKEHRTDILITSNNTPIVNGKTAPPINFGIVDNKGYEISVKWEDKVSKNFSYHINPNVSYAKNIVIEKDEVKPNQPYLSQTGKSVGQMFGYEFFGFYNGTTTEDAYKSAYGVTSFPTQLIPGGLKPGDAVYVDLDGNGKITADDRHALGFPEYPAYTFGLNIGCNIYGVDFSMLWGGSKDVSRKLDRLFRPAMTAQHNESLLQWSFDKRWTPETASTATLPRASFASEGNNTQDSRLWIVDAGFIRLRNIEIGYSIKPQLLKKLNISNLRVYMNAYNLLTFTNNFPGGDPEQLRDELDNMKYPNTKVINVGLNIGL